ncbi:hypothetical protein ACFFRR_002508 [Megaselia abdita]
METDEILTIDSFDPLRKPIVNLIVEGVTIRCLIDTGSTLKVITTKKLDYKIRDLEAPIKYSFLMGEAEIMEKMITPIPIEFNHSRKIEWTIVDLQGKEFEAILGFPAILRLGMEIHPQFIKVRGNEIKFMTNEEVERSLMRCPYKPEQ